MEQKNIFIVLTGSIFISLSIFILIILIKQHTPLPDPITTPEEISDTPLTNREVELERSSLEKIVASSSGTETDATLDLQITPDKIATTSQLIRANTNDQIDSSTLILDPSDVKVSSNPTTLVSVTGTIFGIDVPNNLFIIIHNGEKKRISVTPKTTFSINKKVLYFSSLHTGDVVTVSGQKDTTGDEITAQVVTITGVFDF